MKFAIIGRTATGKHYLVEKLIEQGYKLAKTFTTNPDTPVGVGYPEIISAADAAAVPAEKKFLMVSEDGTETYMLYEDMAQADLMILHPDDLPNIAPFMEDERLKVIHTVCKDAIAQDACDQAVPKYPGKDLKTRQMKETPAYSSFEQRLAAKHTFGLPQLTTINLENDYKPETIEGFLLQLSYNMQMHRNLRDIVDECIALGVINVDNNGKVIVTYQEPTPHTAGISVDMFLDILINNPADMSVVMMNWLSLSHDVTMGNRIYMENLAKEGLDTSVEEGVPEDDGATLSAEELDSFLDKHIVDHTADKK